MDLVPKANGTAWWRGIRISHEYDSDQVFLDGGRWHAPLGAAKGGVILDEKTGDALVLRASVREAITEIFEAYVADGLYGVIRDD